MNILRMLKLKKINNDFDHLNEKEKDFLCVFDELKQIEKDDRIYFHDKNHINFFCYDLEINNFWCNYDKVWRVFETKYQMNYKQINELIERILREHLKFRNDTMAKCKKKM